ncbi:hypothetical protein J6590_010730 [Homalodisca vitripennis]|nr:hypothetical protein J6590_010730 [Homalodisca vitripennis]
MEVEVQNKLSFLNVCVLRYRDVLKTTVFQKKTHTGKYLNYQSNHQKSVKGVAYSLFDRAKNLCSDKDGLREEFDDIWKLMANCSICAEGKPRFLKSSATFVKVKLPPLNASTSTSQVCFYQH